MNGTKFTLYFLITQNNVISGAAPILGHFIEKQPNISDTSISRNEPLLKLRKAFSEM